MNDLQNKMKVKSRHQPSKTVEALFKAAVVKIKADNDETIAERKANSKTEAVSATADSENETKDPTLEQKVETQVETEAKIETNAIVPETESLEQTAANETNPEAEPVSQEEIEQTLESDTEQNIATEDTEQDIAAEDAEQDIAAEDAEQDIEAVDADVLEEEIEEKPEVTAQDQEPVADEVSETIQQMSASQTKQPSEQLLTGLDLCAKDIMQKELAWGTPEYSIQETIKKMEQHSTGYLLIGQDGILQGLVSKSDLAGAVSSYLRPEFAKWRRVEDDATLQIKVKWIMSRPVHIIGPQVSLEALMRRMSQLSVHALPVVDQQGKVLGLVTETDIFKTILKPNSAANTHALDKDHQVEPEIPQAPKNQPAEPNQPPLAPAV